MPITYRWTHDDSREPVSLARPLRSSETQMKIATREEGVFVGGAYQLGMGDPGLEIVHLDVAHSEPPLFLALRGLWGTLVRDHPAKSPLVPVRRLYLDF